jgi:nucleotidyltransferase/DNA polymerase involved in DNA repair
VFLELAPNSDNGPLVTRTILHVDLDAFYAAVEMRENPDLVGQPVVVGADPRAGRGRGVVAAASYEARAFGIHSAMPIGQAYRRCPDAVFLRPRMSLYAAVSGRFMQILRRYTDLIEPLSIDEAFLDVTGSATLFGDGPSIARRIKDEVRREEQLTASIGVAPTKFIAKIASDLEKPDGLVVVPANEVQAFLRDLPIRRLWGAGPKTVVKLERLGIKTIGDVAALPPATLERTFGTSMAQHFAALAHGIDPRPVVSGVERKSLGHETTFTEDVQDRSTVRHRLLELVDAVTRDLRHNGMLGDSVSLKLRTADFDTVTRQAALPAPSDTSDAIWPVARRLFSKADATKQPIRLIGISVSIAADAPQLALFDAPAGDRHRRLARAIDAVTTRFGASAITRATALGESGKKDRVAPRRRKEKLATDEHR